MASLCHLLRCGHKTQSVLSQGVYWTAHYKLTNLQVSLAKYQHQPHNKIANCYSTLCNKHTPMIHQGRNFHLQQVRTFSYQEFYLKYFTPANPPVAKAIELLEGIHDYTCLPWWASIPFTVVLVRTCITLPLTVYTAKVLAKVELLQPEIKQLAGELNKEVNIAVRNLKWDEATARAQYKVNLKRIVRDLYIRDNCHPFKSTILVLVQLPLWVTLSVALRNMSGGFGNQNLPLLTPGLKTEGMLWFPDLTLADTTCLLPAALVISNLIISEISALMMNRNNKLSRWMTNFFRGVSLVMFPIALSVPSCMAYYWVCSSLYGLSQNMLLKSPRVRRGLGIPKTPKEPQHPYREIADMLKQKMSRQKKDTTC